jgi:GAF domain-containing protein
MSATQAAVAVAEISAALTGDFDLPALLATVADHARLGLDAFSAVVVLIDRRSALAGNDIENTVQIVAEALRDGVVADLDFHMTGPGLFSANEGAVAMINDLTQADDTHWPEYRRRALAAGMRAVRAFPVVSLGVSLGSLVVHTDEPWGSDRPQTFGQIMANLTAVALASAAGDSRRLDTTNTIETLLDGRVTIASAIGILSEVLDLGVEEARLALTRLARAHGSSVSAHAREVVDGHNADPLRSSVAAPWARPPDLPVPRHIDG